MRVHKIYKYIVCKIYLYLYIYICIYIYIYIRRPLASFGLGRAEPGVTAGVRHCPWALLWPPCLTLAFKSCLVMYLELVLKLAFGTFGSTRPNPCPTCFGLLGPPCVTRAFQAAWSCIVKGVRNCRLALLKWYCNLAD